MMDLTARLAELILRHRRRLGRARLGRRLGATRLSKAQIDAAFRFSSFLAARGPSPEAPAHARVAGRVSRGRAWTAAGLAAWGGLVTSLATFRLWAGGAGAGAAEPMPEELWVRQALAAYRPPLLGEPALLDELLAARGPGNACAAYLEAAALARPDARRLLARERQREPADAVGALELGLSRQDCAILGRLRNPRDEDAWAGLSLDVALAERLGETFRKRAEARMAAGRWDLAQREALSGLALGRHLLEDWLPEVQAAGLRHVDAGLELLGRCLAARGRLDPETRLRLGRVEAQARAYAWNSAELSRIRRLGRDAAGLEALAPFLGDPLLRRPYAHAALEAAALAWTPQEIARGAADPGRVRWLARACRHGEPRVAALAQAQLARLGRIELRCRALSVERRLRECPRLQ
ncbi:MAG: hypothetical protein HY554_04145 [Elusimicrobia bacterium]|nr:hypothetical protein [Elusimicrobiota bacterium]